MWAGTWNSCFEGFPGLYAGFVGLAGALGAFWPFPAFAEWAAGELWTDLPPWCDLDACLLGFCIIFDLGALFEAVFLALCAGFAAVFFDGVMLILLGLECEIAKKSGKSCIEYHRWPDGTMSIIWLICAVLWILALTISIYNYMLFLKSSFRESGHMLGGCGFFPLQPHKFRIDEKYS